MTKFKPGDVIIARGGYYNPQLIIRITPNGYRTYIMDVTMGTKNRTYDTAYADYLFELYTDVFTEEES